MTSILPGSNDRAHPASRDGAQCRLTGVLLALLGLGVGACTPLLPRGEAQVSRFPSYIDARQAVESLRPHASTLANLKSAGIDPDTDPNIRLLTAMDVIQRFSQTPLRREAIDPGMLMCMEALDQCLGMELTATRISKKRTGLFIPDFFNFSRTTETSGWRFQALILLVNGVVVHRSWGGEPNIHDVEITTNPLGPLQEIGPVLVQGR